MYQQRLEWKSSPTVKDIFVPFAKFSLSAGIIGDSTVSQGITDYKALLWLVIGSHRVCSGCCSSLICWSRAWVINPTTQSLLSNIWPQTFKFFSSSTVITTGKNMVKIMWSCQTLERLHGKWLRMVWYHHYWLVYTDALQSTSPYCTWSCDALTQWVLKCARPHISSQPPPPNHHHHHHHQSSQSSSQTSLNPCNNIITCISINHEDHHCHKHQHIVIIIITKFLQWP